MSSGICIYTNMSTYAYTWTYLSGAKSISPVFVMCCVKVTYIHVYMNI